MSVCFQQNLNLSESNKYHMSYSFIYKHLISLIQIIINILSLGYQILSMQTNKVHSQSFKSTWYPRLKSCRGHEGQKVNFSKHKQRIEGSKKNQAYVPVLDFDRNKLLYKNSPFTARKDGNKRTQYQNKIFTKNSPHFRTKSSDGQSITLWSTARSFTKSISEDQNLLNNFLLLKKLGKGSFGQVQLALQKTTSMLFAIKIICKKDIKQKSMQEQVLRELKISLFCQHPNIVKSYGIFDDQDKIYIIQEYVFDGCLYNLKAKKSIPENKISMLIRQICEALKYLHEANVFHRDVKLQNILMVNDIAKLCDFGCSAYGVELRNTHTGSPLYLSPEQLKQEYYNNKIDLWSLGVVTFELFFGKAPYDQQIAKIIFRQTQKKQLPQVYFPWQIPQDAKDFIKKTLNKNQNQRLSAKQALFHPFLRTAIQNKLIFQ